MLFEKRTQKAVKVIWSILGILVIAGMIALYMPAFYQ